MSRLRYLRVFNVRDNFIPRVLLLPTFWLRRIYLETSQLRIWVRLHQYRGYHAELLCYHKALRRKSLLTAQGRGSVLFGAWTAIGVFHGFSCCERLATFTCCPTLRYLSFFFFFFIGRTWSTFKLGTKPSVTNFSDRKLNMTAAR